MSGSSTVTRLTWPLTWREIVLAGMSFLTSKNGNDCTPTPPFSNAEKVIFVWNRHDPAYAEEVMACPWIGRKALDNLVRGACTHNQKNVRRIFQRPAENHETFLLQIVHEGSISIPPPLALQGRRPLPCPASRTNHSKQFHGRAIIAPLQR